MKTPKEYEIDSLKKLLNVINEENYDRIIIDLAKFLRIFTLHTKELRDKFPEETKGKTNYQLTKPIFKWIDDNKNEIKECAILDSDTGRKIIIKIPNKK